MKKNLLLLTALVCIAGATQAQKEKKYKEIFYKDITLEADDFTASTNNGTSDKESTKFKLKIVNKTNDILMYKPEESTFKVGDKEAKPKEKVLMVYPADSDFRVVNLISADYLVPNYSFVMGGMYKISTKGTVAEAADFKLPAAANEFEAGGFSCTLSSLTKETDKTEAKFECRYTGSKIGVINPGKAVVKMPDGTEIANEKKHSTPIVLMKGKSEKITFKWNRMEGGKATDMQKVNMVIVFKGTFTETDAEKLKDETLNFELDPAVTK
jgi:hypothetical protein